MSSTEENLAGAFRDVIQRAQFLLAATIQHRHNTKSMSAEEVRTRAARLNDSVQNLSEKCLSSLEAADDQDTTE